MATQKVRPDAGATERQLGHQRGRSRNRKVSAFEVAGVIGIVAVVVAVVVVIRAAGEGPGTQLGGQPSGAGSILTEEPIQTLWTSGPVEPGRYVFSSADSDLDASHEITIDVPEGYTSVGGTAVLKDGTGQTSVSTLAIGEVYADPCRWQASALLDGSAISSADGLVAALAGQEGLRVSAPTAATVDGFAATYLERRVPTATDVSDCDRGEFHLYSAPGWRERWLDGGGQLQRLWIVDVDGMPFVVDATIEPDTSQEVQAELERMVESVQIDPR